MLPLLTSCSPLTGQSIDYQRFSGSRGRGGSGRGGFGGSTPSRVPHDWQGSRTPMGAGNDSRTPAWGVSSRSELYLSSLSRTSADQVAAPAWAANGGRSNHLHSFSRSASTDTPIAPAWKSDSFAGSRTPAYGADGGRTVNAYADGSRTAYGGAGGVRPRVVVNRDPRLADKAAEDTCIQPFLAHPFWRVWLQRCVQRRIEDSLCRFWRLTNTSLSRFCSQ